MMLYQFTKYLTIAPLYFVNISPHLTHKLKISQSGLGQPVFYQEYLASSHEGKNSQSGFGQPGFNQEYLVSSHEGKILQSGLGQPGFISGVPSQLL